MSDSIIESKTIANRLINEFNTEIEIFCEEQNINDLKAEPSSVFNACMMYISKAVLTDPYILKDKGYKGGIDMHPISNCNAYDYYILNILCDYYIYICNVYDKVPSIVGYSFLCNIDNCNVSMWAKDGSVNPERFGIWQKITAYRENSLSDKLTQKGVNPVGALAILNHQYAWASAIASEKSDTAQETVNLMSKYQPKLSDNL